MTQSRHIYRPRHCDVVQWFWTRVARAGTDDCWRWLGGTHLGYGRFTIGDRHVLAHRYAWMMTYGSIHDGFDVLHTCDNPPCCNPRHLFLGTQTDNNADMMRKGRQRSPRGEANSNTKFTDDTVRFIRAEAASGVSGRKLAQRFSVAHSTINRIVSRMVWKHV